MGTAGRLKREHAEVVSGALDAAAAAGAGNFGAAEYTTS